MREKSYVCGFRSKNKFQLTFIWLTPIYKELRYEKKKRTVPLHTTRSQSHKNFTVCALEEVFGELWPPRSPDLIICDITL